MTLKEAIFLRDTEYVVDWIANRHGIIIPLLEVDAILGRSFDFGGRDDSESEMREWSEASWATWIKLQLAKSGFLRPGCPPSEENEFAVGTFHFGFVSVIENEDHLTLLRREKDEPLPPWLNEARSRLFSCYYKMVPVNRVAFRVSGEDPFGGSKKPGVQRPKPKVKRTNRRVRRPKPKVKQPKPEIRLSNQFNLDDLKKNVGTIGGHGLKLGDHVDFFWVSTWYHGIVTDLTPAKATIKIADNARKNVSYRKIRQSARFTGI